MTEPTSGPEPVRLAMARLWAGWRLAYLENPDPASTAPPGAGSLFERILNSGWPDEQTYILWRGERCFALLNAYPYTGGHLMVLPNRAIQHLEDLDDEEYHEMWHGVRLGVRALKAAYDCPAVNVGANLGQAAGAGVPDHLHVHVVPRWRGDTNFMTTVAEVRVLPEPLDATWRKLKDAWPADSTSR